jgi:hypothetical protein
MPVNCWNRYEANTFLFKLRIYYRIDSYQVVYRTSRYVFRYGILRVTSDSRRMCPELKKSDSQILDHPIEVGGLKSSIFRKDVSSFEDRFPERSS